MRSCSPRPRLLCADDDARLLVTRRLPGELCEGTDWATDPAIHRAAGALLIQLQQAAPPRWSEDRGRATRDSAVLLLERARDLITTEDYDAVGGLLGALEPVGAWLVPTHGDFQPRNWLVDADRPRLDGSPSVSLIDFGRFDLRPWYSDLIRLHHQDFVDQPPYLLCRPWAMLGAREVRRCRYGSWPPVTSMAWGVLPPARSGA